MRGGNATPGLGLVVHAGVRFTFVNVECSLTGIGEMVESNGGYKGTRKRFPSCGYDLARRDESTNQGFAWSSKHSETLGTRNDGWLSTRTHPTEVLARFAQMRASPPISNRNVAESNFPRPHRLLYGPHTRDDAATATSGERYERNDRFFQVFHCVYSNRESSKKYTLGYK